MGRKIHNMKEDSVKGIIIIIIASTIVSACIQKQNNNKQIIQKSTIEKLNSSEFQTRIIAINTIGEKKYKKLNHRLISIILKKNEAQTKESKEEKYICAKALGKSLDAQKAIKYSMIWIDAKDKTLQIAALYLIDSTLEHNKINDNTKQRIGEKITKLLNKQRYEKRVDYNIVKKIAIIIGKLKYQKAYQTLLYFAKEKLIVIEEITNTLKSLKNQNKEIEKLIPIQKIEDKRITRTIKETQYAKDKRDNYNLEKRLIKNLIDLKSPVFISAYNSENYFKLFLTNKKILKNTFGKSETYNPEKIKYIIANRIPFLRKALNDKNKKMRFKTVKILAHIKDKRLCEPLTKAYQQNKNTNFKKTILHAIAEINCPNTTKFIEEGDNEKKPDSPFFVHLKNNPELIHNFIQKYHYLYAYEELFPKKIRYINELINSTNEQTKINALYSLSRSKINTKNDILKQSLVKEENLNIKPFIQKLIRQTIFN